jgi:hypothetical protein
MTQYKIISLFFVSFFFQYSLLSQKSIENYEIHIDTVELKQHLYILASDSFQGRKTGEKGQFLAADYIQNQFQIMGLSKAPNMDSYFQNFKLIEKSKSGIMSLNGQTLNFLDDFGFYDHFETLRSVNNELIYISDFKKLSGQVDYSEKVLIMEVSSIKEVDLFKAKEIYAKAIVYILTKYDQRYFSSFNDDELYFPENKNKIPYLFISKSSLNKENQKKLAEFKSSNKSNEIFGSLDVFLNENPKYVETQNVVAYIEGSDSVLKKEIVVISAHYDHLGFKHEKIYNGADDNGSGTVALLELAQAFQQSKNENNNPKRSLLFLAFTGEEMGLYGSLYYVNNPIIPLRKTITDLNIDMIGRVTKPTEKDTFSVYIIGSDRLSLDLHNMNEKANKNYSHLKLDYTYNDPNDKLNLYYRSDHYNFAVNEVPSIFYFGGFHKDYHKETDTVDKINFDKIKQICNLVFHTTWMLGNMEERPKIIIH